MITCKSCNTEITYVDLNAGYCTNCQTQIVHTPNGYDPAWIAAINQVLEDRGSPLRITDLTDDSWTTFLGPLVDCLEQKDQELAVYAE